MPEVPAEPARLHAEDVDREEDEERERERGLEVLGRRVDSGDEQREVRGRDEQEQSPEERDEATRLLGRDLADLIVEGRHEELEKRLPLPGHEPEPARGEPARGAQDDGDPDARRQRALDRDRPELDEDRILEADPGHGAVSLAALRLAASPATVKPKRAGRSEEH